MSNTEKDRSVERMTSPMRVWIDGALAYDPDAGDDEDADTGKKRDADKPADGD